MARETARPALLFCVCMLASLWGCGAPRAGDAEIIRSEPAHAEMLRGGPAEGRVPGAYRLRVGDIVFLRFMTDPGLNQETPVTPQGTVTVPMAGDVPAAGLTVEELGESIKARMAAYLLDPAVSITLDTLAPQPVYVLGEVKVPGAVTSTGELTVTRVLAEAGGILSSGKPGSVMIVRTYGVPEPLAIRVDVGDVLSGRDLSQDVELYPNDVVFVPKSAIGKVNEFIDLFLNKIAPAQLFYLRGYDMTHLEGRVLID